MTRPAKEINLLYLDRLFAKEDDAETRAEVSGIDDGPVVEVLQGEISVLNKRSSTCTTRNACFLLSEHYRFLNFEKGSTYFQDALLLLLKVYAKQVVSPESNVPRKEIW